ncbi:MAG: hypothetical protein KKD07_03050 [Candidatus Omnitrophica bacterium]|nr:hypothetical protein [Candidatus Omnitrophota bacterium]MBU1997086.1 hypothetical protein [Candidatus Omnitrophota bacterium]MBU4333399.1 hypothetical protein [Candidatus Omnitrophota bacterium]
MSCSNIPTKVLLKLDKEDRFVSFNFVKLACKCSESPNDKICNYLKGQTLNEIFEISLSKAFDDLNITLEEDEFMFKLELDALKAAIANYLGIDNETVDKERCQILSIYHDDEGTSINMVILPPKA